MAGHATNEINSATAWGGKISPFNVSYGKLMMWFFLTSDALTFGGFLVAFGFARFSAQEAWPIGEQTFNALPFLGGGFPLVYVALMTFLLIMSSVTMVLAVEAGHRMDRRGVTRWMFATIIGGLFFVGSQAWEWSHFIHGTEFGRVELEDGSMAIVAAKEFGAIENFTVTKAGNKYKANQVITNKDMDLLHAFQDAATLGHMKGGMITLKDGSEAKISKKADKEMELIIKKTGSKNEIGKVISGPEAARQYYGAIQAGEANKVIYGANLTQNEYGPKVYANYFFFITGFHGFHVSIGILLNIIVFLNVLKGTYQKRGHYEMVEKVGLYWHFVDLVWVFVFTFFYLI